MMLCDITSVINDVHGIFQQHSQNRIIEPMTFGPAFLDQQRVGFKPHPSIYGSSTYGKSKTNHTLTSLSQ